MNTMHKALLFLCSTVLITYAQAQPGTHISLETFYHELEPYGTWIDDPEYGYVWSPDVSADFQPYLTEGHWVMTAYGNTWVSYYDWGWAPFHYGRWRYDDYYGWIWIPGTEWGPAWVAWRSGGGYYGWAPLGPGIDIHVSVHVGRYIPRHHWFFVRKHYFHHPRIYSYCAPRPRVVNIIHHTTIINNTYINNNRRVYYTGPGIRDIERATRSRVQVHQIQQSVRPGASAVRNGSLHVYRPAESAERGRFTPASSRAAASDRSTSGRSERNKTYDRGRSVDALQGSKSRSLQRGSHENSRRERAGVVSGTSSGRSTVGGGRETNRVPARGRDLDPTNRRNSQDAATDRRESRDRQPVYQDRGRTERQYTPPARENRNKESIRSPYQGRSNTRDISSGQERRKSSSDAYSRGAVERRQQSRTPAVQRSSSPRRSESQVQSRSHTQRSSGRSRDQQ